MLQILEDGRRSRTDRPRPSPVRASPHRLNRHTSPIRRAQSSRDRSSDRPTIRRGYSTEALDDRRYDHKGKFQSKRPLLTCNMCNGEKCCQKFCMSAKWGREMQTEMCIKNLHLSGILTPFLRCGLP